ncbi:MAG: hypothetical protein AAGF84_00270 [Planctomycetota bacterium]
MVLLVFLLLLAYGAFLARHANQQVVDQAKFEVFVDADPQLLSWARVRGDVLDEMPGWVGMIEGWVTGRRFVNALEPMDFDFERGYSPPDWLRINELPNRMASATADAEPFVWMGRRNAYGEVFRYRQDASVPGVPPWHWPTGAERRLRSIAGVLGVEENYVEDWYDDITDHTVEPVEKGLKLAPGP